MPGMTSAPRKGRRDLEPANCLNETGVDCTKVRARGFALGWAATVMSPCGVVNCKVLGQQWPLLTNRMTELVTYGSVGGGGSDPAPYPAADRDQPFRSLAGTCASGGWPPRLTLIVGHSMRHLQSREPGYENFLCMDCLGGVRFRVLLLRRAGDNYARI